MSDGFHLIVPAAGSGTRFGGSVRKQFLELCGETLLKRVLDTFQKTALLKSVCIACPQAEWEQVISVYGDTNHNIQVVAGGETRAHSVQKAFFALSLSSSKDIVLIHDAARPLVSQDLIKKIFRATQERAAAVPALAITDTIKQVQGDQCIKTLDRAQYRVVQTPQGFQAAILQKAYDCLDVRDPLLTDEASLIEKMGVYPVWVPGEAANIKITQAADLSEAERLLRM